MTPATTFLIFGLSLVAVLCTVAFVRARARSPRRSVDEFHTAMRALASRTVAPRGRRRG